MNQTLSKLMQPVKDINTTISASLHTIALLSRQWEEKEAMKLVRLQQRRAKHLAKQVNP